MWYWLFLSPPTVAVHRVHIYDLVLLLLMMLFKLKVKLNVSDYKLQASELSSRCQETVVRALSMQCTRTVKST